MAVNFCRGGGHYFNDDVERDYCDRPECEAARRKVPPEPSPAVNRRPCRCAKASKNWATTPPLLILAKHNATATARQSSEENMMTTPGSDAAFNAAYSPPTGPPPDAHRVTGSFKDQWYGQWNPSDAPVDPHDVGYTVGEGGSFGDNRAIPVGSRSLAVNKR